MSRDNNMMLRCCTSGSVLPTSMKAKEQREEGEQRGKIAKNAGMPV
jgi:hypothetical protein